MRGCSPAWPRRSERSSPGAPPRPSDADADATRVGPAFAPALAARLARARRIAGGAELEAWLGAGDGIPAEPGRPDRLVIPGLGAVAGLDAAALDALWLRACLLALAGYAAARLAGPAGLPDLVRCVLRAAGRSNEVPAPFDALVPGLSEALDRARPAEVSGLAVEAEGALGDFDPAALLEALELSASRLALLACGNAGALLRRRSVPPTASAARTGPRSILAAAADALPEIRDQLLTLLRDDLSDLRRRCRPETLP